VKRTTEKPPVYRKINVRFWVLILTDWKYGTKNRYGIVANLGSSTQVLIPVFAALNKTKNY